MTRGLAFLLVLVGAACSSNESSERDELVVSAAASLQEVMTAAAENFEEAHPSVLVRLNFASSGALRQQIELGSPVEVFVSASTEQVDRLVESGLVASADRRIFARNELVLVTTKESVRTLDDLQDDAITRVAIGDPRSVPAGQYALQWLEAEGLWERIQEKTVLGGDVRQVLSYVERGEVDAGIVYATDAKVAGLEPVWTASGPSAPAVVYEAALVGGRREPRAVARQFFDYLASDEAIRELETAGFLAP
ncbi:MAG: molybdate ABC transporter substrate-binding protein [Vicinamibacteria bacterium]